MNVKRCQPELMELVEALCHGEITPEQAKRLETIVCEDGQARQDYVRYIHMHANLSQHSALQPSQAEADELKAVAAAWLAQEQASCSDELVGMKDSDAEPTNHPPNLGSLGSLLGGADPISAPDLESGGQPFTLLRKLIPAAPQLDRWLEMAPVVITGLLVMAFGIVVAVKQFRETSSPPLAEHVTTHDADGAETRPAEYVATLVATVDCQWDDTASPQDRAPLLSVGRMRLAKGIAEIAFDGGATVFLEGPTDFELEGPNSGFLHSGKLMAMVPRAAVGFTIRTSTTNVIDLGTEFGLLVDGQSRAAEVYVFDGQVELEPQSRGAQTASLSRLISGEAARIDLEQGLIQRIVLPESVDAKRVSFSSMRDHAGGAKQRVLLADHFRDDVLNPLKWTTNTAIPRGSARVMEINGRIELVNRGSLVTAQQYDPLTVGGLRITGRWTFAQIDSEAAVDMDLLQVLTRSSGTPDGAFGETTEGVEFQSTLTTLSILGRGDVAVTAVSTPITISEGDVFDFEIFDDGINLSITLTEVGGDGTMASVSTTSTTDAATDFVVFHNREIVGGSGHVAYLDDVVLEAVSRGGESP